EDETVQLGDLLDAPLVLRGDDDGAGAGLTQRAHVVLVDGHGLVAGPGAGHHGAGPRGHADERATSALRHAVVLSAVERCAGPSVDDWTQSIAAAVRRASCVAECDGAARRSPRRRRTTESSAAARAGQRSAPTLPCCSIACR